MKKDKVLYILTRYPDPIVTGRHKMIDQNIRFLAKHFEVTVAYFSKQHNGERNNPLFNEYQLNFPGLFQLILNLLFRAKYSLQERLFYSKSNQKLINRLIKEKQPRVVI